MQGVLKKARDGARSRIRSRLGGNRHFLPVGREKFVMPAGAEKCKAGVWNFFEFYFLNFRLLRADPAFRGLSRNRCGLALRFIRVLAVAQR